MMNCVCSDEDRTTKIKEEVGLCGGIMVHLLHSTWLYLSEMDGPDINREFFYKSMFSLMEMELLIKREIKCF